MNLWTFLWIGVCLWLHHVHDPASISPPHPQPQERWARRRQYMTCAVYFLVLLSSLCGSNVPWFIFCLQVWDLCLITPHPQERLALRRRYTCGLFPRAVVKQSLQIKCSMMPPSVGSLSHLPLPQERLARSLQCVCDGTVHFLVLSLNEFCVPKDRPLLQAQDPTDTPPGRRLGLYIVQLYLSAAFLGV